MKAIVELIKIGVAVVSMLVFAGTAIVIGPSVYERYAYGIMSDSVVYLYSDANKRSGTGFHVMAPSGRSLILTNRHVCESSRDNSLMAASKAMGLKPTQIQITRVSEESDLCELEPIPGFYPLHLADEDVEPGQSVFSAGHPGHEPLTISYGHYIGFFKTVTWDKVLSDEEVASGECKRKKGQVKEFRVNTEGKLEWVCHDTYDLHMSTVLSYPGSSGSPLVNRYGFVVGVVRSSSAVLNYAGHVPFVNVKAFLENQ